MKNCAWMVMIAGLFSVFPAQGQEESNGQALAATCTGCHGTGGVSSGPIPSIGGMEAQQMAALLHEFRDGKRPGTIMPQLAKGYTDAQIEALSRWFATH
ncbi:MAG: c-type cytochrome [Burkholderiales bacterium]|nr:c-type cytochrome [Burkholderiales bacterium]